MEKSFKFNRITTVMTTVVSLLCCPPQEAVCASIQIDQIAMNLINYPINSILPMLSIEIDPPRSLENSFSDLTEAIHDAEDPLAITRQFFQAFLDQLNSQNGTSFTMEEACQLLKQNMDLAPLEYREILRLGINSIESNSLTTQDPILNATAAIYWPWEWNWFGLNKHEKKHHHRAITMQSAKIQPKLLVFGLIVAGIVIVAIFNPAAVGAAAKAMAEVAPLFI